MKTIFSNLLFLTICASLILLVQSQLKSIEDCPPKEGSEEPNYLLKDIEVVLEPTTPVGGSPLLVKVKGNLSEDLTKEQKSVIKAEVSGFSLLSPSYNLCKEVKLTGGKCPVKAATDATITLTINLWKIATSDKPRDVTISAMTKDKRPIFCKKASIKIS